VTKMNDFNINPDYKKYRQKQKNKAAKLHKLKVFATVFSLILIAASVISVLAVSGAFQKPKDPAASENPTALPVGTETATSTAPPQTTKKGVTVFIDAGHGYHNPDKSFNEGIGNGSPYYDISGGKTESDFTLELALKLRDILKENGYDVIMFREDVISASINDAYSSSVANKRFADVFISIHGRSGMPTQRGASIIYSNNHRNADACQKLAASVASAIDKTSGTVSKNKVDLQTRDLAVCTETNMPAIEIEALCLSNEQDSKLAVSDSWQQRFAEALAAGIMAEFPL